MNKYRIESDDKMSNRQYHKAGKANWWARVGSGDDASFLTIPRTRGDEYLDCTIEVEDESSSVTIGCGPNNKHGIRETIKLL